MSETAVICHQARSAKKSGSNTPACILMLLCVFLSSCRYYRAISRPTDLAGLTALQSHGGNVVLHYGPHVWQLTLTELDSLQRNVKGRIHTLQGKQKQYCTNMEGLKRYRRKQYDPLQDFHLFVSEVAITEDSLVLIPFSAIHLAAENKMSKPTNLAIKALIALPVILVSIVYYLYDNMEFF